MSIVKLKLKHAVNLGKKLEHLFISLNGTEGFPYINSAHGIEQIAENQVAIEEWTCPVTVRDLSEHPEMAILIWDPATDDGYEILGRVLMIESQECLNGYAPEAEQNTFAPQVRRRLFIRAEKIVAFSHDLRCDDINKIPHPKVESGQFKEGSFVPYCGFAPEWAEHARFNREDEPCDNGRTGESQACPEEAQQCVVGTP